MPTKTKPKVRARSAVSVPLKISDKHMEAIGNCLGLGDSVDEQLKLKRFQINLERRLTKYSSELRGLGNVPLPAHIVAELEPIGKAAAKLAELIQRDKLTEKARRALNSPSEDPYGPPKIGAPSLVARLASDLQTLVQNAEIAIAKLRPRSRPRQDRTVKSDYLRQVEFHLQREFDAIAQAATDSDREEFLEICHAYLTATRVPRVASRDDPSLRIDATIAIGPTYTFDPKNPRVPPLEDAKTWHNELGEEYALDKPADQDG